ncbi:MAG: sugar-binding domain-containing protein [Bacteroidota bacterium]
MIRQFLKLFFTGSLCIFLLSIGCNKALFNPPSDSFRKVVKLNENWQFQLGDATENSAAELDATTWRTLQLPHDWSVEGVYDTIYGTDWQSGYLPAGTAWYRKDFTVGVNPKDHRVELQFDGIYGNSTIYVNGQLVGTHRYGYTGFFFPIEKWLHQGKNNIAVRVDHSKPQSGRWYTGSGIYREVWLRILPKVHFQTWEQSATTAFVNDSIDLLKSNFKVKNNNKKSTTGKLVQKVYGADLQLLKTHEQSLVIAAQAEKEISEAVELTRPDLWTLESPRMHTLVHQLYDDDDKLLDSDTIHFGVRKIEFSAKWGFKLNDELTKIKGVCMHHAAGIYGAAVPESILLYRLQLLKAMGCNAIRTAHNPFSPSFYTMCDTLGLLVLDEIFDGWEKEKAADDYGLYFEEDWQKDVTSWIKNNRNHPSIFMYSIGNEVAKPTRATQKMLIDFIKNMDDTRPITQGGHDPTRGMKDQLAKTHLDIKGFNGDGEEIGRYEAYHAKHPSVPIIATEVPHTYQTRGVYRTTTHWRRQDFPAKWEINSGSAGTMRGLEGKCYPIEDLAVKEIFTEEQTHFYTVNDTALPIHNEHSWKENLYYQSSYDNATVRSSARKAWQKAEELDYVMGQFRWTAFDYLGETNQWPSRFANFGIIDIANLPKDHYYLYQSLWSDEPMVHLLPHWTHSGKEGTNIPVVVYTNAEEVDLLLNGKSLGKQPYVGEQLVWQIPYQKGTLTAQAYHQGKMVAEKSYTTACGTQYLRMEAYKDTLSSTLRENVMVVIDVVDNDGNLFPYANDYITVQVEGAGKLRGLDNGDPLDLTPYTATAKKAFRGKLVAFVETQGRGQITVRVKSKEGLNQSLVLFSQ